MKKCIYQIRKITSIVVMALIVIGTSCNKKTPDEASSAPEQTVKDFVILTGKQMTQAGIKTGTFINKQLGQRVEANGTIELPPNNLASINVPMEGFVEDIRYLEGAAVKKGQTLVVLKHPNYIQLQQDYLQAISQLTYLEKELARQKTLSEAKVSAEKTLQKTASEHGAIRAQVNALKEKLRFLGIAADNVLKGDIQSLVYLPAPFDGTVTKLNGHKGQLVTPQDVIMEVINRDHMHIELQVFQRDIPRVKEGQNILFTVPAYEDGKVYLGEVSLVGKNLDLTTKTIRVHGHFEEEDYLIPGLYVEAKIVTDSGKRRSLPEAAIIRDQGKHYFFTLSAKEGAHQRFQKVEVIPGITDAGFTEILSFNQESDTSMIVTEGAFYIKSQMNKVGGGQGH